MGILSLGKRLQLWRKVQPSAKTWEGQVKWTLRTLQSLLCGDVHNGAQKANWAWGWGEWPVSVIDKGMYVSMLCILYAIVLLSLPLQHNHKHTHTHMYAHAYTHANERCVPGVYRLGSQRSQAWGANRGSLIGGSRHQKETGERAGA